MSADEAAMDVFDDEESASLTDEMRAKIKPQFLTQRQGKGGMCECGCGQPAPLATRTDRRVGHVRGEPQRFILGHRWALPNWFTQFVVEDHGYLTPCHIWTGAVNKHTGYGYVGAVPAPRLMWERINGQMPKGLEPDHLCRVRLCVRLDHLEPVTRSENMRRSPLVGRWVRSTPRQNGGCTSVIG